MDADYWKARCQAAEEVLQRTRSSIAMTDLRRAVIAALGDLKPRAALDTKQIAAAIDYPVRQAYRLLCDMQRAGLVDQVPPVAGGDSFGRPAWRWRLAHLVQVTAEAENTEC